MPEAAPKVTAALPHRRFQPEEQARSRAAVPLGFLGMLALVVAVEQGVRLAGPALLDPVSLSWTESAKAARTVAPKCDVLCLGDSLAKHGLLASVIATETGRPTYNLAVAAGPAPVTYTILRRALDAGAKPSAVLLEFKPSLLAGGPRYRMREWPELLTFGETLDLACTARSGSLGVELFLGKLLATFRRRQEIRLNVLAALRGEASLASRINRVLLRNWSVNHGTHVPTPRPDYRGEVSEEKQADLLSHRFAVHKVNAAYVRRIVDLLASREIPTYLVVPPLVPAVLDRRAETGAEAKFDAFLRSLQERHATLTVLDARPAHYPAEVFVDPVHLDPRGAATLSRDAAAVVRRGTAERWVALPEYRPVAVGADVEDFEQSRLRLGITLNP